MLREPNIVQTKDRWSITSTIRAQPLYLNQSLGFAEVVSGRRTIRTCSPMELGDVLAVVRYAMHSQQVGEGENLGRLRKASMSAGALHPIEVLIVAGPGVTEPILYCDGGDIFGTVQFLAPEIATTELGNLAAIVPQASGHFLLFVANVRHTGQAYENPLSLLWRDAGTVLQTFSLLAAATDCSFVPLGSTGGALLETLDTPHADYVAVGTAIIGRASTPIGSSSP